MFRHTQVEEDYPGFNLLEDFVHNYFSWLLLVPKLAVISQFPDFPHIGREAKLGDDGVAFIAGVTLGYEVTHELCSGAALLIVDSEFRRDSIPDM